MPTSAESGTLLIQSAHAILTLDGKYVLQLRDNSVLIPASGLWSLFGGRIEEGETPLQAIQREIAEELSIMPVAYCFLWSDERYAEFEQAVIRMWFFQAAVEEVWPHHRLTEGRAVEVFGVEQLTHLDMHPVMRESLLRYFNSHADPCRNSH